MWSGGAGRYTVGMVADRRVRPWLPALVAAGAIAFWWLAAIRYAYHGQATALFMIGERTPMPDWLEKSETLYRWKGGGGYDGQYFHLLAHAPLAFHELASMMDRPRMRCQRILIPALVWLLASGRMEWIDPVYYAVILLSLAAGVWCTARLAQRNAASPWWGLAFLALPASIGSAERMLVDGPLMAAAAGVVLLLESGRWPAAWILAAAAPFVRETGLLIVAAVVIVNLAKRAWMSAALWAAAGAPFLLWLLMIRDLPGGMDFRWAGLFHSAVRLASEGEPYSRYPQYRAWLHGLDLIVLAGFLSACAASLQLLWSAWRRRAPLSLPLSMAAVSAGAALALCHLEPRHAWDSVFSLGRVFAPVYLGLLLHGLAAGRPGMAALCLMPAAIRASLPLGPVLVRAAQGLAG
jgi:hypothetical protein